MRHLNELMAKCDDSLEWRALSTESLEGYLAKGIDPVPFMIHRIMRWCSVSEQMLQRNLFLSQISRHAKN